jgi:general secretion pathway protein G
MEYNERYHSPGFTFMELIVAILILGLLAGIGVPMYLRWAETARESTTQSNLRLLKNEITKFNIEHGKYPSRLEDLSERPKGEIGKKWKPYLDKLPKDGWSQEFYYKVTPGGKNPYELYSYGGSAGPEEPAERRISVWKL